MGTRECMIFHDLLVTFQVVQNEGVVDDDDVDDDIIGNDDL